MPLVPGFLLILLLVMLEPDLGTTCCFLLILLGLLWMVGMPMRYFAVVVIAIAGAVTLLAFAAPYRWQRITTFLHPFKDAKNTGFHTVEGLYALASGGFFGVGIGQGTSKYGWVPNANSDYVFAIIGEELGLIGCLAVLVLFGMLAYTGMRIARRNADPFVRIVAGGATVWLCGQAVINVGYVCGLLPVTGIPLPFISAGGTSLLASFFVLGMLTSFARHETPAVAAAREAERRGTRTRVERMLRIPVPRPYAAPKRRASRTAVESAPAGRPRRSRAASTRATTRGSTAAAPFDSAPRLDAVACHRHRRDAAAGAVSAPGTTGARIVVAGGGTAGHIEPAMNLADEVRRLDPSAVVTAIGSEKGLDTTLIPARGYPLELVPPVPSAASCRARPVRHSRQAAPSGRRGCARSCAGSTPMSSSASAVTSRCPPTSRRGSARSPSSCMRPTPSRGWPTAAPLG